MSPRFHQIAAAALLSLAAFSFTANAQQGKRAAAPAPAPAAAAPSAAAWSDLHWRNIGPEGNRFSAAAGIPGDPLTYYVGAASGGIWKTTDGGTNWRPLFDAQPVQSIGSLAVARSDKNVIWAGTDDGNLQLSRDGGLTFTEVGKNLPGLPRAALSGDNLYWISRIDASHFDPGTAYVSVDGHRSDDLRPYVFVTRDYGKTFQSIANDLPSYGNVQVIREDPRNKDLLFVGTEFGLYVSTNAGQHWEKFMNDYPTVRTDDILIHPRDGDVIVATHGRSIWIADDITPLEQLTPTVQAQDVALLNPRPAVAYVTDLTNNPHIGGQKNFVGENAPRGTAISYYLKSGANDVKLSIVDAPGRIETNIDTRPVAASEHLIRIHAERGDLRLFVSEDLGQDTHWIVWKSCENSTSAFSLARALKLSRESTAS